METLRYLAQDGHTVICSIHHSRGSVYAKFDDVALLAGGSLIYVGPANDEVLAYFSKFGGLGVGIDLLLGWQWGSKKPFMFTIWDNLTDNEGVVLLQLLHEHTVILAKQVVVTAYHRDMETLAEKILAMRAEQVYETVVVQYHYIGKGLGRKMPVIEFEY
ncbi:hypothetical protein MTR67_031004 [Solanum verrucosum]|uniref:Uncharacterized protein n=1 Tax=Solanum verrucosum TaxID=315347 RepID=A0AAF0U1N6_SOLVR|nr:hypothetical protein MTR67_031004 [Solanum verrucosum]